MSADKGFNFSALDESFIAQKKNHFQLSCQIQPVTEDLCLVSTAPGGNGGEFREIDGFQMNFYGIKLDVPSSYIRVSYPQ